MALMANNPTDTTPYPTILIMRATHTTPCPPILKTYR